MKGRERGILGEEADKSDSEGVYRRNRIYPSGAERYRASHVEGHDQVSQDKFRLASWETAQSKGPSFKLYKSLCIVSIPLVGPRKSHDGSLSGAAHLQLK